MIHNKKPLSMAEVMEYIKGLEGKEALVTYLKKFTKLTQEDSEKLRKSISSLNNQKIKEDNIVKIIDFLPHDKEDVNKILIEANLNEEEANAVLNIIKGN